MAGRVDARCQIPKDPKRLEDVVMQDLTMESAALDDYTLADLVHGPRGLKALLVRSWPRRCDEWCGLQPE